MLKSTEIAERIKETYGRNALSLTLSRLEHFYLRLYRATGLEEYALPVALEWLANEDNLVEVVASLGDRGMIKRASEKVFEEYETWDRKKFIVRKKIYEKHKELLLYILLAQWLVKQKNYKLEGSFYKKIFTFFSQLDLKKEFFSDLDVLKYDPIHVINTVYYLYQAGVVDLRRELKDKFCQVFLASEKFSGYMYENMVYGLTHFIIADSGFYQHYIKRADFEWVFDYFEGNTERILKEINVDIIGEVGMCYKLCRQKGKVRRLCEKFVRDSFDEKLGYIPRKGKDLSRTAHRNIVAYLLLVENDRFYEGPDLSRVNFLKEKFVEN